MSDARWRQITSGFQTVGGQRIPVRDVPANTIARMAQVVGVTSEQLVEAGRSDAAEELGALPLAEGPSGPLTVEERVAALASEVHSLRAELEALRGEKHRNDKTG